jgi:hypothetical protein
VESFAVHVRNLVDFFYAQQPRADDVIAEDFVADAVQWSAIRPEMSAVLRRAKQRADKEIAHLTYARLDVAREVKPWPFVEICGEITAVLQLFARNVERDRLDQCFEELLRPPQ